MKLDLRLGDCLELMRDIADGSIDMICTDLPYGTTTCKWDSIIPFEQLWEQYRRITKPHAAIVLTATQPFTTSLIASNLKDFRYCWVWNKRRPSNPMQAKVQCLKVHEDIAVFSKGRHLYNPQGIVETDGKARGGVNPSKTGLDYGVRVKRVYKQTHTGYPKSIIEFGSDNSKNVHPTQKPVELMEYLIRTYTNPGDTVLDSCMGSGTTGVACMNLGRRFIGIEKDSAYFQIASERIRAAVPQAANDAVQQAIDFA
jgi:site-specific DNA-methyltransferase (adenine-specific)